MKKRKSKTAGQIKRDLWQIFSLYIRTRDALKTTGTLDWVLCFTCDRKYPTAGSSAMQAGHFIAGRHNAILFDERNCAAQCYGCNVGKKGNMVEYFIKMQRVYGDEVIEELRNLDKQNKQFKRHELEALKEHFSQKLSALNEQKK